MLLYFVIVLIVFCKGDSALGMESRFVVLMFFTGIPFLVYAKPAHIPPLVMVFFSTGAFQICLADANVFRPRYAYLENTLAEMDTQHIEKGFAAAYASKNSDLLLGK